jgi:methyl coenzyme M reductase subunit D
MPAVKLSISVDDAHLDQISDICNQLQSCGLEVEQTLPTLGMISGSIDSEQVNRLYAVEGVQHIEVEQGYRLAPPESDLQ